MPMSRLASSLLACSEVLVACSAAAGIGFRCSMGPTSFRQPAPLLVLKLGMSARGLYVT
ncbi:hypothetical protein B0H10DRAFT_2032910 [Mycena sp. CBHHK59/15]|nr:hypothetical protein B0H10DRAFT_2032910 [Mycena sp. CBHHK59/15]